MILAPSPFAHMQAAVDIVATSPHPANKIAATLACAGGQTLSRTNAWPPAIAERLGTETQIGNASGTIHAETACILACRHATQGAALFVTDPPCPNCMKNIAEAGITALYIDHKGFGKDFARRRGDQFEAMSLRIAERAGIAISILYRKEQRIEPILSIQAGYTPLEEYPPKISSCAADEFTPSLDALQSEYGEKPYAAALTKDENGATFLLSACAHAAIGYSHETLESPDGKYNFMLEPINRILMGAARRGLALIPGYVYSSRIPTAREMINLVGADHGSISIGDGNSARDIYGPIALKQLTTSGILSVIIAA